MFISIIVPTYNRERILNSFFNALEKQKYSSGGFEVIIIDDGSKDSTKKIISERIGKKKLNIEYLHQYHRGPAAARNLGVHKARGNILLFLGDDILADKNLIVEHAEWHGKFKKENIAVLGYVAWSNRVKINSLMKWLEESGTQFAFNDLKNKKTSDFRYFYTANISVKKSFITKNGFFDEDFPFAAYEDLELGYRLEEKGLKILFNNKAIGFHNHFLDLKEFDRRLVTVGRAAKILFSKHPELKGCIAKDKLTFTEMTREYIDPLLYYLTKPFHLNKIRNRYYATRALKNYMRGLSEK